MKKVVTKLLICWSLALGIAGASLLSTGIWGNLTALALPEAEVLGKLSEVLVFLMVDEQGAPLVQSVEDQVKVAGVFISQKDANEFFTQLQTENPELAGKVEVTPVSLGGVYQLSQSAESQDNALNFVYIPEKEAVNFAKIILEANDSQYKYLGGVPLFLARGGDEKGYLTIEIRSEQVIPVFFDKKQLDKMLARFKEQKPDIAASVDIQVVFLKNLISDLETGENEILEKIVLVPTAESSQLLESLRTQK